MHHMALHPLRRWSSIGIGEYSAYSKLVELVNLQLVICVLQLVNLQHIVISHPIPFELDVFIEDFVQRYPQFIAYRYLDPPSQLT